MTTLCVSLEMLKTILCPESFLPAKVQRILFFGRVRKKEEIDYQLVDEVIPKQV